MTSSGEESMFKSSHQNGFSLVLLPGVVFRVLLFSKTLFCKVIFYNKFAGLVWLDFVYKTERERERESRKRQSYYFYNGLGTKFQERGINKNVVHKQTTHLVIFCTTVWFNKCDTYLYHARIDENVSTISTRPVNAFHKKWVKSAHCRRENKSCL